MLVIPPILYIEWMKIQNIMCLIKSFDIPTVEDPEPRALFLFYEQKRETLMVFFILFF